MGVAAASVGGGTNRSNLNGAGTDLPQSEHDDADYVSIATLRTRLAAIDAGYYTAAQLNLMTRNDMVYAVRLNDAPLTIRQ